MTTWLQRACAVARAAGEAAAETLWPTRCAVCDAPGKVLCERCEAALVFVDWWRACRRCGAPFGFAQCDACNDVALALLGREALPYAGCASAVIFDDDAGRVVRTFKDQGEQRLADVMASCMLRCIPPDWSFDAVAFVPATLAAYRHRGFDHAELLARQVASGVQLPCLPLLSRPRTRDQRHLSAKQRIANLAGSFSARDEARASGAEHAGSSICGGSLLLVDDVCTTGATLCAATDALLSAGAAEVRCLTFTRV